MGKKFTLFSSWTEKGSTVTAFFPINVKKIHSIFIMDRERFDCYCFFFPINGKKIHSIFIMDRERFVQFRSDFVEFIELINMSYGIRQTVIQSSNQNLS